MRFYNYNLNNMYNNGLMDGIIYTKQLIRSIMIIVPVSIWLHVIPSMLCYRMK